MKNDHFRFLVIQPWANQVLLGRGVTIRRLCFVYLVSCGLQLDHGLPDPLQELLVTPLLPELLLLP